MSAPSGRTPAGSPLTAEELIERLGLAPLPMEGGLYRETWRSSVPLPGVAAPPGITRSAGTAIYYLLTPATASTMHRLPIDELYHFLLGDPVEMLQLEDGAPSRWLVLGHDLRAGEALQVVVPAGTWQGSRLRGGGTWALMSVTVAPGFEFSDYESAHADALAAVWPDAAAFVHALAR
jgi:predicted cupin superfamily sugar epimerase